MIDISLFSEQKYCVAGIGTEVGRTYISSLLVEALKADYWKPIQAGELDFSDTDKVKKYVKNQKSAFHPEEYRLRQPISPHAAAKYDKLIIDLANLVLPKTTNQLIVELAGGIMVPLNDKDTNLDLLQKFQLPVILVSKNYLGSINHTLLTVEVLKSRNIPVAGIIFNGDENLDTESIILKKTGLDCLAKIAWQN